MVKLFSTEHTFAHPFSRVSSAFWRKYPNEHAAHVQAIDCYDRRMVDIGDIDTDDDDDRRPQPQRPSLDHSSLHVTDSPSSVSSSSSSSSPSSSLAAPYSSSSTAFSSTSSSSPPTPSPCLVSNRVISCYTALPVWLNKLGVSNHAYAIETSVVNPSTRQMVVRSRNVTGASFMVMEETCTYSQNKLNPLHTDYRQTAKITAFLPMFSGNFESFTLHSVTKKSKEGLETIERICQRLREEAMDGLM